MTVQDSRQGSGLASGGARVQVRVPATSANLGPGFDSFGIALAKYDEVTVELTGEGLSVEVSGEAADQVPRDETHLVVSSLLSACRRWSGEPPGLRVRCHNTIPHGRGLGSSAGAIVAGVVAARALVAGADGADPDGVDDVEVLDLASEMEGHPDNVAAALAGGFTLAWSTGSGTRAARLTPHDAVLPVACVPAWPMSTETARGLLPATVPYGDAVFNAARSGLLVAALTQLPDRLLEATEDRLHQPYRAPAMRPTADLMKRLRAQDVPAVLSGAGPTVLALCDRRRHTAAEVAAIAGADWQVESPGVDLRGAVARRLPGRE
ncbi:MAG TPA: homoserine kinase [Nocardioidaceae bacterium]|nr:homoserine kinase [Nocardioidaceae bacterium]